MELTFDEASFGLIQCPECRGTFLHHKTVTVYWRAGEDADHGLRLQSDQQSVQTTTDMTGNPSARRDGIEVEFWCESCHARPRLTIAQHKGATQVQWVNPPAVSKD